MTPQAFATGEDSEYALEPLCERADFTLYRGTERGNTMRILAAVATAEPPSPQVLRRLEHEYSLATELDAAGAARPLALVRYQGRAALLLKDPGGDPLDRIIERHQGRDLDRFLPIAIGLAAALSRVHLQGLIHKDIKPANALVDETGQVWLTGFGIASRLPREHQALVPPENIAGTLAYMAPEQTGRMNRSIDSRSDLYSLGVTLYQLLMGELPFTAAEPLEWIHCHIARQPLAPVDRGAIPEPLSAIIMKLLAKNAEERYQTATGLEGDLRRCLAPWRSHGRIDSFALGADDLSGRLLIPEKLYAREREVGTLLAAFERVVAGGKPELVLVSGYSGVGKSAVVTELHKWLIPPRGLFVAGKFDQYKRDIPYATVAQIFQKLTHPLLSKPEVELRRWRDDLRRMLGPNGALVIDLVPELKLIIGEQPPVAFLSPQDAKTRSHFAFRRFIGVFAHAEHPLAMIFDDLQWLDAATLDFLEDLLVQQDLAHLLVVGAYRDNEVDAAHPLTRKLSAIHQAGAAVHEIRLMPLGPGELTHLIADSLHCDPQRAMPLAQLIHAKTGGNPFFAIQFFHALVDEDLIGLEHGNARWRWDLDAIHAKGYTDNVVDLMVAKLNRLPTGAQRALQQLACIGNSAEAAILCAVLETSEQETETQLREALRLELIVRSDQSYRFAHDRIQEAAYSLLAHEARADAHLRIGRLLNGQARPEAREEAIFEIVNQFNRGTDFIISANERFQLAELNLAASKRAKSSTAYASALRYSVAGAALLTNDCWDSHHDLIYQLEFNRAECEFLTGEPVSAAERMEMLRSRAANTVELAMATCLGADVYHTLGQLDRAIAIGLAYLQSIGIDWSLHPTQEQVRAEYERIWSKLGSRTIEDIFEFPLMRDSTSIATLDVLTKLFSPASFMDTDLVALIICRAISLSIEHGSSDASCLQYVWFGIVAGPKFGDYRAGSRFGQLGYELVEKRGLKRFQAATYTSFATITMPWMKHLPACRDVMRRAYEVANNIGDLTWAVFSLYHLNGLLIATGGSLVEAHHEAENALKLAQKAKFGFMADLINQPLGLIRTLRGVTTSFGSFDHAEFDESLVERQLDSQPGMVQCWYLIRKLQACFFAGDFTSAVEASVKTRALLVPSPSFELAEYAFYSALAHAALCVSAAAGEGRKHFDALESHHKQLQIWAEHCPENFEDRTALVAAEIARIEGRELDAERLYEEAIGSAREHTFVHNEAVAHEVAARFYAARGFDRFADAYLREARSCYDRWGADGKVRQLEAHHPRLRVQELRSQPAVSPLAAMIDAPVVQLDAATVVKASQTLSGEISLPRLIEKLMRLAIEHAGAERTLLILLHQDEPRIEAQAKAERGEIEILIRQEGVTPIDLPQSVFQYVLRTGERVLLDDASTRQPGFSDEYIRDRRPRSVLCLPIRRQAKMVGVLYLENNVAANAFTPARVAVIDMLASQAAISLENARLYSDLQRNETFLAQGQSISQTGTFGWNTASGEVFWSEEIYKIFEYDPTERPTADLVFRRIHPADQDFARQTFDLAIGEKRDLDFELRFLMVDGRVKNTHVIARVMNAGNLDFVGAVRDITERTRAGEALREAQDDLARVHRVTTMGELTASLAHELSQPISGTLTNANVCLRKLGRDNPDLDEVRTAITRILRDTQRGADIIGRIRAQFWRGSRNREVIDVNEINRETVALLRNEAMRHNISVRTELAHDLPEIVGDRVQLQQVAMNLIVNGIEATKEVDGMREIVVKSERAEHERILISISDTGMGFAPHLAEKIFEPFFTTKPHGTGMGLRICRSIVESHGGRLWAVSTPGRGAIFYLNLPVRGKFHGA